MKFKNNKGKNLKTTMSNDIMNQVADIVENKLRTKDIFHIRNGTKFSVAQNDIDNLLCAQQEANIFLIKTGVITSDMIAKEFKGNF